MIYAFKKRNLISVQFFCTVSIEMATILLSFLAKILIELIHYFVQPKITLPRTSYLMG